MGTCAYCAKAKEKQGTILIRVANTEFTGNLTDRIKTEVKTSHKQRRSLSRKVSCEFNFRSEEDIDAPSAIVTSKPKFAEDKNLIKKALSHHFLFSFLPEENIEELIGHMKHYLLGEKEIIFKQGDPGYNFFILAEGIVEIIINGTIRGHINEGHGFGELALIHDSQRTATIRTINKVKLWGIGRKIFRDAIKKISGLKYEENKHFLQDVPFLKPLTNEQIDMLVNVAANNIFNDGEVIVVEGDPGNIFYIIEEGIVQCSKKNKVIRSLRAGEYFGEQALLYNSFRTATVTAKGRVKVLSLGSDMLISVLGGGLQKIAYKNTLRICFDNCEILRHLTSTQKEALIENTEILTFKEKEIVINEETKMGKHIWFVLKGSLKDSENIINVFENLGAKWIFEGTSGIFSHNIISSSETDVGILSNKKLKEILKESLISRIFKNKMIKMLKKVYLLRFIPSQKLEELANLVTIKDFSAGTEIFSQGDPGESFYIIKSGEVYIKKDTVIIRSISEGDYFGERSIIKGENRTASVICRTDCTLWILSREDFLTLIDESMYKKIIKRMHLQDDTINLSDLFIVKSLGNGMFGNVFLCAMHKTKIPYALKTVTRKKIAENNLYESLVLERKALLQIDHPFITKLVKTFKDENRVYFLLEYVHGLGLYQVLRILNLVNTHMCRFYTGCLLLILEHLHKHNIIYRDLKPENLMVDEDGYLKLLDFGTAKIIKGRTYSVMGTPHYMAPEVILGKGYSFSADLWSLGIMIYEFVCGMVPFGENVEDEPSEVYKEIIQGQFTYPKFVKSTCREKIIIEQLLRLSPSMRGTAEQLKHHKWLNGLNWDDLITKKIRPSYIPQLEDLDTLIESSSTQHCSIELILSSRETFDYEHTARKLKFVNPNWDEEF